jgi:hypothetical protein
MALEGENNEILLLRIHVSIVVDSDCLSLYYKKLVCLYCDNDNICCLKRGYKWLNRNSFLQRTLT